MSKQASGADKNLTIQAAVLRRLVHGPPGGFDWAELKALIGGADPPSGMVVRIQRALDVLAGIGLVALVDDKYVPSRAAVHYRQLLIR